MKKFVAAAACAVLSLAFAGCGKKPGTEPEKPARTRTAWFARSRNFA